MKLYRETALRKQADPPTLAMLDLWQSLCQQKIGLPVEVMVGDRKEHRQLSSFEGELYAVMPHVIQGKVALVLWLDSLSNVKPLLVTHEIGHWVLKLQGFSTSLYRPNRHTDVEIMLNSMAHHPPLYALQKSLGHEPQVEVYSRCVHDIRLFSKGKEANEKSLWVTNALMLADDIFNCSDENRLPLENVLSKDHRNTWNLAKKIVKLASGYNLLLPDQNSAFRQAIIQDLGIGPHWDEVQEAESLLSMCTTAREGRTNPDNKDVKERRFIQEQP